jgi:hypothetical protein
LKNGIAALLAARNIQAEKIRKIRITQVINNAIVVLGLKTTYIISG